VARLATVAAVTPTVPLLPTLGPSATPITYTVKPNDTLLGIALRYGVTLEAMEAANPGIDPQFLSIGQRLIVPAPEASQTATPVPTPTPFTIPLSPPRCYHEASGSLWCLLTAMNPAGPALEGVSALITLLADDGRPIVTVAAYPPLNLLEQGEAMVLAAYLPPPAPGFARAAAVLVSAVPAQDQVNRYPELQVTGLTDRPGESDRSWQAQGRLSSTAQQAVKATVVLQAFDRQGEVVGFTQWEAPKPLRPGDTADFVLTVYSLGPAINRITTAVEGQTAPSP
jgi:murein DD-endopeptidase MepM/ murein hydrolase activator NlpD